MKKFYGLTATLLLEEMATPLGIAMVPRLQVEKKEPNVKVTIKKITTMQWMQIISFLIWTQIKYGQEGLIHGYYKEKPNEGEEPWIIEPPLQEPNGMTVKQISTGEEGEENRQRFAELEANGYICRFTAHHHCNSSAFQSQTDKEDEHSKPTGYHVTIGELNKDILSFHSRTVIRVPGIVNEQTQEVISEAHTTQIDGVPTNFIETPMDKVAEEYPWLKTAITGFFTHKHNVPFPEEWKDAVSVTQLARSAEISTEANDIATIIEFVKKGQIAALFNDVLNLDNAPKQAAYRGMNAPEIQGFNWRGIRAKKRRALFDALYRMTGFFIEIFTKRPDYDPTKAAPMNEIMEAYIKRGSDRGYTRTFTTDKFLGTNPFPGLPTTGNHGLDKQMTTARSINAMTPKEYAAWEETHYGQ